MIYCSGYLFIFIILDSQLVPLMEETREHKKRALNRLENLNDGEFFDHKNVLVSKHFF